ncbi:MAG TPA: SulP family inorganic anion transporter [Candidatus Paceibacterota bacterium]|nr:SulP family inorganic anion transporter [Candidatus Paceibacterota bacterium]
MNITEYKKLIGENWKSGLTVACISVPLSIALSIASGAGPVPGLIAGVWATLIASIFGGSNFNIVGAAGALTTVLFAATLTAPMGLGALALPLIAIATGVVILLVWMARAERYLYYIPSSVMYGFSAGVAFLIAVSQLFDATGLSSLKRTGHFIGDMSLFMSHVTEVHGASLLTCAVFLFSILTWKRFIKKLPAVIPASIAGIIFGYIEAQYIPLNLISLGDKFGSFAGALFVPMPWDTFLTLITQPTYVVWLFKIAGVVALIAILETLITAKIGDSLTKTRSSSSKELLGLGLANIGSGVMGGLPATGVFIRTGANIKAGATHKTSATIAAVVTAVIAVIALPFFSYIPMAVIAALLVNTALGLIETEKFKEFWMHERSSFWIALIVVGITVIEDAGVAVVVGALLALLVFADSISHGRFDAIINYRDGRKEDIRGRRRLTFLKDETPIEIFTYSIAGTLGYIDSAQHAENFRKIAKNTSIEHVILRLRDLFSIDFEGREMLKEAVAELADAGKRVYVTSANEQVRAHILSFPLFANEKHVFIKTSDALAFIRSQNKGM